MPTTNNDKEAMVSTRVLVEERDLLDDFVAASGLTRAEIVRSMIHLLPTVAEQIAETAETLPERPADRVRRENARRATAAWVEQSRQRRRA